MAGTLAKTRFTIVNLGVSILLALPIVCGTAEFAFGQTGAFQDGQQAVEIKDSPNPEGFRPKVGRKAAAKYMAPRQGSKEGGSEEKDDQENEGGQKTSGHGFHGGASDHYLAVHVGFFPNDNAYKWGIPDNQTNVGKYNFGLTYRMGEWVNSMDLLVRFDVARIELAEGPVTKFSFLPVITFPDATSRFPLYFGAGVGLGVFGNQIAGESGISLDYQFLAGARFFNLWGQTGLFVEGGIKNHLLLLSDGQFNGTFIATGLVFTF
ncbi:hypothetical protein BH10BDE1_BH10BDE1_00770 [soil metagenome]